MGLSLSVSRGTHTKVVSWVSNACSQGLQPPFLGNLRIVWTFPKKVWVPATEAAYISGHVGTASQLRQCQSLSRASAHPWPSQQRIRAPPFRWSSWSRADACARPRGTFPREGTTLFPFPLVLATDDIPTLSHIPAFCNSLESVEFSSSLIFFSYSVWHVQLSFQYYGVYVVVAAIQIFRCF